MIARYDTDMLGCLNDQLQHAEKDFKSESLVVEEVAAIATALPAEDVASAPGATIGPAACVCELATASPALRAAASSTACVDFIMGSPVGICRSERTL